MWLYIYPSIYLIIIIVGFINYHKYKHNKYLVYYLAFLCYTLVSEIIGGYFGRILLIRTNIIYNTWNIIAFLFYTIFFMQRISSLKRRMILKFIILFFVIGTVINALFFKNYVNEIFIYNILLGKFLIVVGVIIYYLDLLESDAILHIQKSLFFWISLGVLLYNIGFLPAIAIVKYTSFGGNFKYITLGLNIIASSCFIAGFLISKRKFNT